MNKLSKVAAVAGASTIAAAISMAPALAVSPGQLEGGALVYQVRNVTQDGSYASSVTANACEEVKFSIRLHNVAYGSLSNINVKATLPSGGTSIVSTMTATPDSGASAGTSGTATVNLSQAQNINYESGSTVLYDGNSNVIKNLPDGVVGSGVNIGGLNGSTTEFVNFKAKVNCSTPPVTPPVTPQVTPPSTPSTPATNLPQTGADELAGLAGTAGTGVIGYGAVMYRRSKKALAQSLLNRK